MAHQIEQMAYVGATPWHGLGNNLPQKQPIEVWQREAGMDWQILESPVHFKSDAIGHLGAIHSFPEQKVLYRSDTKAPLSVAINKNLPVTDIKSLMAYAKANPGKLTYASFGAGTTSHMAGEFLPDGSNRIKQLETGHTMAAPVSFDFPAQNVYSSSPVTSR